MTDTAEQFAPSMTEDMFLSELARAVAFVEHSLTTSINFEGTAEGLVVDEIQFLMNAGCVILDTPSHSVCNILDAERQTICDHVSSKTTHTEQHTIEDVLVTRQRFPAVGSGYHLSLPLRRALQDATAGYTVTTRSTAGGSLPPLTLRIYYDPQKAPFGFWASDSFARAASRMLTIAAPFNEESPPALPEGGNRLYTQFLESVYLESVLTALQQRIVDHLVRGNAHFHAFAQNPFFLQFFLPTEPAAVAPERHWLRFFPLNKQRAALSDPQTARGVDDSLNAQGLSLPPGSSLLQFLTHDYLWDADRSFVGYTYETGTALYLRDWETEPRVIGAHLSPDDQRLRNVATGVMQRLRGKTPHLFLVPLLSKKRPIAVAVINCPEDVDARARIAPVRSARGLGYLLSLALETDDLVNHVQEERRRATAVRSYKHATQSILHGEGSYCMELEGFLHRLQQMQIPEIDAEVDGYVERISFIIRDKQDLINEFRTVVDPIREIRLERIYPTRDGKTSEGAAATSVQYLQDTVPMLGRLVRHGGSKLAIDLRIGNTLHLCLAVADFSHFILDRIIVNLLRNAARAGMERAVPEPQIAISLEIVNGGPRKALRILAEDNCGGFDDDLLTTTGGEITFDLWSHYLEQKESPRGMGFFMLAKYAGATNGSCRISNVVGDSGRIGARVELLLGLNVA